MSTSRDWEPWEWCDEQGIRVVSQAMPIGRMGEWHPLQRLIVLAADLTGIQETSVLSHECGHAALLHAGCLPSQEGAADAWAAGRLISAEEYAEVERIYENDFGRMAAELGVMQWVVVAWRRSELEQRRWSSYFDGQDLIA